MLQKGELIVYIKTICQNVTVNLLFLLMPFVLLDKCRRIWELKERSSVLALWIWGSEKSDKMGSTEVGSSGSHVCVYRCKTVVRTVSGNSKCFEVNVHMHQGSALSPLLFVINGSHI